MVQLDAFLHKCVHVWRLDLLVALRPVPSGVCPTEIWGTGQKGLLGLYVLARGVSTYRLRDA